MMTKLCIVGDRHFGVGSEQFLESQLNFDYKVLIPYMKSNNIDTVIFLGDVFDNRKNLNVYVKNKVFDLFCEYEKLDIKIHIIFGNHDTYHKNSNDINSLKWLEKFKNIKLYSGIEENKIGDKNFLFVGWQYDLNNYINFVTSNDLGNIDVCVGHFDVVGSKMSSGVISNVGYNKSYIMRFPLVFSGHYHSMSVEKNAKSTLVYTGTPYQLTRGDKGENKYFFVLELDSLKYEKVENKNSIKFVDVVFGEELDKEKINNSIIDLHISENIDVDELETYKDNIRKFEPVSITTRIIPKINEQQKEEIKFKSLKELFFEYINGITIEEEFKNKTMEKVNILFDEHYSE